MVRTAVLGFAHSHISGITEQWQKHPEYGVELVCGWDAQDQRCRDGCEKLGIARAGSVSQIMEDESVQAVIIGSETAYHAQLAVEAARAKKKIIVYKPLALTLEQADSIVNAVEENGVDFTVAWQMRVDPVNLEIKRIINSGELGRPFYFRRRHSLSVHTWADFENSWHVNPALNRDIFADDSAHPIDWMISLFGMPQTVMCELATEYSPKIPNDLGVALFKYPSGLLCEVSFCAVASAAEHTTEVYFEHGSLQHYGGDGVSTRLPHKGMTALKWFKEGDADWTVSPIPVPDGQWVRICAQAKPLADFLNNKAPAVCTAQQARDSLRAVLKCCESNNEGRRVSI